MAGAKKRAQNASAAAETNAKSSTPGTTPTEVPLTTWDWADPGTWSASYKFLPAYIVLVLIFIAIYWNNFASHSDVDLSSYESCAAGFNYSYHVNAARSQAHRWSKHSWEIATAYEATMEIYQPGRSVFGPNPFPEGKLPQLGMKMDAASTYVEKRFNNNTKDVHEDQSIAGQASLGVATLMLGQKWSGKGYLAKADELKDLVLKDAPRHSNGAISSSSESIEISSDAVAMIPPFLAYYGVATDDLDLVREAVRQIRLYREILLIRETPQEGLWRHVVGSADVSDEGAWSVGNGWAVSGIAKVRATISAWPTSNATLTQEISDLDSWIHEIFQGVLRTDDDVPGLLRNYLGDSTWDGETSGTSLLAATAYRVADQNPAMFRHLRAWANRKRKAVVSRVDEDGIVKPAANALEARSREPVDSSPVGQSFLLLLGTAWRDCVCSDKGAVCLLAYLAETHSKPAKPVSLESTIGVSWESISGYPSAQWRRLSNYFSGPASQQSQKREL